MKSVTRTLFLFSLIGLFLHSPFFIAQAANNSDSKNNSFGKMTDSYKEYRNLTNDSSGDIVNCFKYYHFGSVKVDVSSQLDTVANGSKITFKGKVDNDNDYPIVDGTLYVRVLRDADEGQNTPDIVDEFSVADDINIPARSSMPVAFTWNIPAHTITGNYHIATFFVVAHKFNLLGLTFTDDAVGNTVDFSVIGERKDGVFFDRDKATINDKGYVFAAPSPVFDAKESVVLTAPVYNSTKKDVRTNMHWKVYYWDAQDKEMLLQEENNPLIIKAGKSASVSIKVDNAQYPVYFAVAKVEYKDTVSILNMRFIRNGISRARINFPSITKYPLKGGQETTLFSCVHNVAPSVTNGVLTLSLIDNKTNKVIHEYTYNGKITGEMLGVASHFTPKKDYDSMTLKAKLVSGGKVIESVVMNYDCNTLNPEFCERDSGDSKDKDTFFGGNLSDYLFPLIAGFVLIVSILFVFFRLLSTRKGKDNNSI